MASLPCFGILKTTDTSIQFIIVTQIIHLWFSAFKWGKLEIQVIPLASTCLAPFYSPKVPLYTIV